ncbi:translocation/assembly module TamB domain-containing protein [Anditalea andensis]|uniref:Outer membrane insertion C-signal n=1 Tax=Anditalea andensis TaxID=1048983 RepID=A0A074L176_9BACT|nr:translocation/assembly module TamB domain-containing protein [Anditalea andensis]KEO74924.1 outer membrane insertion C- signal [Anditalea andensis]
MEKNSKVTQILTKALKVLLSVTLFLIIFLLGIAALFQVPAVQNRITTYLTEYITTHTGFKTSISDVNIRWWDAVSLKDVVVYDQNDSLMANLQNVYIDFSIRGLLDSENPGLDEIRLKNGTVRIITDPIDEEMNIVLFVSRINALLSPSERSSEKVPVKFSITEISLERTSLDILDYTIAPIVEGFDYGKLRFRNLTAIGEDFFTKRDTVAINVKSLRGIEATSGLEVQQLRTDFIYSNTGMEFDNLFMRSNDSVVKNYLKFTYDDVRALNDFNRLVNVEGHLTESVLDLKDLRYFSDNIPDFDDKIYLSGVITGRIDNLKSDQLLIRFGERSAMFGEFTIQGLPYVNETFFRLSLVNSTLTSADLSPYISNEARREVNKFRDIRFDGDFTGYFHNFSASGNFRTGIGNLSGKLNYRNALNVPTYNASIQLSNLDLGILMEDRKAFQKVTMQGQIRGTGLSVESALLAVNADVRSIGINNYNYTNVKTDATYGKDLFSGNLTINDTNLKMQVQGKLDLRDNRDSVRLVARVDTAFLQQLNLVDRELFLSGDFDLDTKGVTLDDVEGVARFEDILISYEGRNLYLDNFLFQSLFTGDSRLIALNSDLLVAGISGNFQVEELTRDVTQLWDDYVRLLTNQTENYNTRKVIIEDNSEYNIDINIDLRDPNPLINLIEPSLFISQNTKIEGAFYQTSENTILNLFSGIDTIYYNGNLFLDNNFDFNTSKIRREDEVLASFYINSRNQELNSGINFNNFIMEAIWDQSAIDLNLALNQPDTESYARIRSKINIFPELTSLSFEPSDIKILDRYWEFDPDNLITFRTDNIAVENLKIFDNGQYLALNGRMAVSSDEVLSLEVSQVDVSILNTLDRRDFSGIAYGLFAFSDIFETPNVNGSIKISDFHINNFLIGDIEASTYFDSENERIYLDLSNLREDRKIITLHGYLGTREDELDLNAQFDQANLSVAEPFLSDYISDMGGTITGQLRIAGKLSEPSVTGLGRLSQGTLRVNYLNTLYTLNGGINFTPNEISFRGLDVADVRGNKAILRGGISHDRFSNFILDISSDLSNFQVLNTTTRDNDLFYGTAYATGKLDIFGAANNLDITAQATTQPNTRIFIPIGSSDGQFKEDYINIINVRDTLQEITVERTVEKLAINNVRMNFNLDITPDAYAEIQIDPRTGESIQGRGSGNLRLGIDTQGNFSMTGTYEIVDAKYNFSLYNIINKEFNIEPGGRITWFGDPYEGIMNIKATYEENVSLISLQPAQTSEADLMDSQLKRRFPLKVIMDMSGELLSPDIGFDFDFSGFPEGEIQTYISAFRNRIANDEQEKNRQVFSLIMLRRFSPEGQFTGAGLGFSNLSQLISSQLNSLISQVDQNLEIDFDLASLNQAAMETFQLRVAYTFLDGRLRVMRDGGFTDLQGNADINTIAGDWQAEYLLTEDGRYRMRIYNRNNFNNAFTSLNLSANVVTYGVSLSQTLSFSSFQELFQMIGRRRRDRLRINDIDDFLRYDFEESDNRKSPPVNADSTVIRIIEPSSMWRKEDDL